MGRVVKICAAIAALWCQNVMAAAGEAPGPALEMRQLQLFQGSWQCNGNQSDSVFGAGHAVQTAVSGKTDFDGHWMVVRFSERRTKANDHPTDGVFYFGFDPAAKQFVANWIDNLGGWGRQLSPGWQNDTLILTGDYNTGGQKLGARDTFQKKNDRSYVHRAELQKGDGTWVPLIEETCTK